MHACDFLGVKTTQVKACQALAVLKHPSHVSCFAGVQILQAFNLGQVLHAAEPVVQVCRLDFAEILVEHHLRTGLCDRC